MHDKQSVTLSSLNNPNKNPLPPYSLLLRLRTPTDIKILYKINEKENFSYWY